MARMTRLERLARDTELAAAVAVPFPTTKQAVKVNDTYSIKVTGGDYLILHVAFTLPTFATEFEHPALAARLVKILEFKHYRASGSKFWTSRPGVELTFIVPRSQVKLLLLETYSYPKVEINGQRFSLNTSGGTDGPGWADWIGAWSSTMVNLPLKIVKAIAAVVVNPFTMSDHEETDPAKLYENKYDLPARNHWLEEAASAIDLNIGSGVVINNTSTMEGQKFTVKEKSKNGQRFILQPSDRIGLVRCARSFIDWLKTAEANGIKVSYPREFSRVPVLEPELVG